MFCCVCGTTIGHHDAFNLNPFNDVEIVECACRVNEFFRLYVHVNDARQVGLRHLADAFGAHFQGAEFFRRAAQRLTHGAAEARQNFSDLRNGLAIGAANSGAGNAVSAHFEFIAELDAEFAVPLRATRDRILGEDDVSGALLWTNGAGGQSSSDGLRDQVVNLGRHWSSGSELLFRDDRSSGEEHSHDASGARRCGKTDQHGSTLQPGDPSRGRYVTTTTPTKEAPPNGHFSKSIRKLLAL